MPKRLMEAGSGTGGGPCQPVISMLPARSASRRRLELSATRSASLFRGNHARAVERYELDPSAFVHGRLKVAPVDA
ncbi:MAG TPA: hypothetical protein VMU01_05070 [Rhizomicrobium sp.]|nr:hypothetical protein [Rhizomicrobium sp.]